jgi:dipeptidyl aminopeptidase/acylaminoacyl peptidase
MLCALRFVVRFQVGYSFCQLIVLAVLLFVGGPRTNSLIAGTHRSPVPRPHPLFQFQGRDNAAIWSLSFSPDSKRLATGSTKGELIVWEVQTGKLLRRFQHTDYIDAVAFSPNRPHLAVGSKNKAKVGRPTEITIWDVDTGKQVLRYHPSHGVSSLLFTPDGKRLVVENGPDVTVLDPETGRRVCMLKRIPGVGRGQLAISQNGKTLAIGYYEDIGIFDVETGDQRSVLKGFAPGVQVVRFGLDNKALRSFHEDGKVRVWNTKTGKPLFTKQGPRFLPDHFHVRQMSADQTIVVGDYPVDRTVTLWDGRTGKRLLTLPPAHQRREAWFNGVVLALSPNGRWLATSDGVALTELWDLSVLLKNKENGK